MELYGFYQPYPYEDEPTEPRRPRKSKEPEEPGEGKKIKKGPKHYAGELSDLVTRMELHLGRQLTQLCKQSNYARIARYEEKILSKAILTD